MFARRLTFLRLTFLRSVIQEPGSAGAQRGDAKEKQSSPCGALRVHAVELARELGRTDTLDLPKLIPLGESRIHVGQSGSRDQEERSPGEGGGAAAPDDEERTEETRRLRFDGRDRDDIRSIGHGGFGAGRGGVGFGGLSGLLKGRRSLAFLDQREVGIGLCAFVRGDFFFLIEKPQGQRPFELARAFEGFGGVPKRARVTGDSIGLQEQLSGLLVAPRLKGLEPFGSSVFSAGGELGRYSLAAGLGPCEARARGADPKGGEAQDASRSSFSQIFTSSALFPPASLLSEVGAGSSEGGEDL